ncbi:hypothetical protein SDC9_202611 [bioreactor metagenome]|uniref:Uncharacterized protein n=1 Tax=bioreactor metagenome TaxID=1076179 RepID=A0A645IVQ2_9ZZZZ
MGQPGGKADEVLFGDPDVKGSFGEVFKEAAVSACAHQIGVYDHDLVVFFSERGYVLAGHIPDGNHISEAFRFAHYSLPHFSK